ncbi:MAG: threonine--tRNA ligase, partial [Elusimicrobia bacterium]|nr:threonine--tRNA ligase [Elusimicrobiota bacterium]
GDEKREQLQRIYGTAFFTKQDLDGYLQKLEEAKKRDHRKLGVHLDLFSIHPEVGAGLIHWHPKGATVRNIIESFWKEQHVRHGYKLVITPHIASEEIYRISGHLEKYSDLMYSPMDIEGNPYRVKPMNCPNHIMIYKTRLHSYRELPLRIAELGTVYRYEKSGVLHGLMRVRGFTIDDAHIFCTEDLLEEEMISIFRFTTGFLKTFGFNEFETFLATRPVDFVGDESTWQKATGALKRAMEKTGHPYEIDEGGGAFYGPKIDLKIKDCLGRAWQCATIQFDFNLPERFNVLYRDEKGADRKVVMIHRALLGSVERFFGVLVEHYGGVFPLWLAPVQACVLSITEKQQEYAGNVAKYLADKKIRTDLDTRNETLNYKIREATESKISYILIVGEKEKEAGKISVRTLAGKNLGQTTLDDFIKSDSFFAPDDIK